ncbi:MAG: thiol reductant ABC exporter subunit CydD, partial [Chloroflexota bacterium]
MFDRDLWREAQSQPLLLATTIALNAAIAAGTVLQAYLLSRIIAAVFLSGATLGGVRDLPSILLAVIIVRALLISLADAAASTLSLRLKRSLRARLFRHLQGLGPAFVQGERSGELINTLTEGVESLDAYFSQYLPQLAIAVLAPLIILSAVATGDLLSAAILLLTAPLIPLFMLLVGHGTRRVTQQQWRLLDQMSSHFLDVLQGLTTLKILGQSRAQIEKVATFSRQFGRATMRVLRVSFLSALVLELVATLSVAIIAVETGLRLLNGTLAFHDALFILILAPEFYLPLRMLGARFHAGMSGVAASQPLFALLQIPSPGSAVARAEQCDARTATGPLRFHHVSFAFDGGKRPAVEDVSLHIEPASHVAIVGPSGSGKSTLVSLLLRFIAPQTGEILVGDQPLEAIERERWLEQVVWVPQMPYLFNDTVSANIALGNPHAKSEAVVDAAKRAGAHEFITRLPDGYQTPIGERGVRLSGGQAQRLALARALLKDAPILILDEPTAHLDLENIRLFQDALQSSGHGRTIITITHRLNTTQHADQLIVMDSGRVVQQLYRPQMSINGNTIETAVGAEPQVPTSADNLAGKNIEPSTVGRRPSVPTGDALRWLISMVVQHKRWILLSIVLGFLTIGSTIGLLGTSAYLISRAALQPSIAALNIAIVAVRFFGLTRGVFRYLERLATHETTFRILARLRTWTFATLEPLAPAHLPSAGSGDLLARLVSDVTTLEQFYVRALAPPVVALVVLTAASIFMAFFHWQLALILSAFLILAGLILPLSMHVVGRGAAQGVVETRAELYARLVDGIQGTSDLAAYSQLESFAQTVDDLSERYRKHQSRQTRLMALQEGLSALITNLAAWVILLAAITHVSAGHFDGLYLGSLVLVTLASFEATLPLSQAVQQIQSSLQAARRLLALERVQPAVAEPAISAGLQPQPDLRVRNLTFHYAVGEPPALDRVNLDLPFGKRLAIVGPSGAGKSTLLNLLLRLWEFRDGEILLDGQTIS